MERCLRNNAEGIRKKPRSTSCPSERSERLELNVMCFTDYRFHLELN